MILVTGHQGFLGSNLMSALGCAAIGLEKCDTFSQWREQLQELWTTHFPEAIVHVGAISDNQYADLDIFDWNVYATQELVRLAASGEAPYLIYISSQTANAAKTLYGHTKAISEMFVKKVGGCIFQPFNIYGSDESMKPVHCQSLPYRLKSENLEVLWDTCRDYIHVDDCVSAILIALEKRFEGAFHLGTGKGTHSNDLAEAFDWAGYRREPRPPHIEYGNPADPGKFLPFWKPSIEILSSGFFE